MTLTLTFDPLHFVNIVKFSMMIRILVTAIVHYCLGAVWNDKCLKKIFLITYSGGNKQTQRIAVPLAISQVLCMALLEKHCVRDHVC